MPVTRVPLLLAAVFAAWSFAPRTRAPYRAEEGRDPAQYAGPPPTRDTVAIGDVHGDYRTFFSLLKRAGLVNAEGHWAGGRRLLVQTGDVLDRGGDSRRVLDLLMRLEKEAREAGGAAVMCLGNHEVLNLAGDLSYVSPGEFAAFAGEETAEERERARRALLRLAQGPPPLLAVSPYRHWRNRLRGRRFEREFPRGYFAHRRAFSLQGTYGRWLLARPVVAKIGDTLFLHGGLSPKYARLSPEEMNRLARRDLYDLLQAVDTLEELGVYHCAFGLEGLRDLLNAARRKEAADPKLHSLLARLREILSGILFRKDGPLWYRGLALEPEATFARELDRILALQNVRRIVVGHTVPRAKRIEGRFGNRVLLIDCGLNRAVYGGRAGALVFDARGRVTALE